MLHLNPPERIQKWKYRPIVPVPAPLADYLTEVEADPKSNGWQCEVGVERIQAVKTAWRAMIKELGLPNHREYGPYLIRHSMASLFRGRGATARDLEGQLGHRTAGTTEI